MISRKKLRNTKEPCTMNTRNTKELSGDDCKDRRQLYCAQDSAVTFDIWKNMQDDLKENNLYWHLKDLATSVMKYSSDFSFDDVLVKKVLPKIPTKRFQYSKILREKEILKEGEEWKPWKLDRNFHHGTSIEKRAICSQLIVNRNQVELEKCLNSLRNQKDFVFFLESYVPKLRTPAYERDIFLPDSLDLKDLKKYTVNTKLKSFSLNYKDLEKNNETPLIVEHWLLGTPSSHISRFSDLKTPEIDEKFWKLHNLNKWRYMMMQSLFQELLDQKGKIQNPLTGSKFTLNQNASEQELMSSIFEEKRLIEICKFCKKLDKPFIVHKNQVLFKI